MKNKILYTELRVDDLYATRRCLTTIIDLIGDGGLVVAMIKITLEKVNEIIENIENGKIKTGTGVQNEK